MNKEREEICNKCRMLPSINHLEYPSCIQPQYPLNEDEWKQLGVKPEDIITIDSFKKFMEISVRPYCREKMLSAHPIEWWFKGLTCRR
ncbi:MAG: hypothetical protein J6S83_06660 [Lachnospiraceae bacterium]|nr:hypothetical protein [Lachnospiraceae bacterium]